MIEINRILFPTDFSRCADQTLTHAIYLSRHFQAELHFLHAIVLHGYTGNNPEYGFASVDAIQRQMEQAAEARMRSAIESNQMDQMKIVRAQKRGISTAPVILDYAHEIDADLIIMGTHGRRGLGHLLLGSVAEEVVRMARCPVLTVRERKEPASIAELDRILVPIDFSEHSIEALKNAKQLAAAYDSRLQLLHVVEQTVHPYFYTLERLRFVDFMEDIKFRAEQELEKLFEETPGPLTSVDFHATVGRAARDIPEFAKIHHSDLIVIASHGLTGIEHLLMGSIVEKVARRAPCPVFTVKTFGKSLIKENQDADRGHPTPGESK